MTARAARAAETGERILDAAMARFSEMAFDAVTLADVAEDAGVTVQTVIRRFGGKEGLFAQLVERESARIGAARTPRGGDEASIEEAVHALVGHYEADGPAILNFLKQEDRSPELAEVVATGRSVHEAWVKTHCASVLAGRRGVDGKRRLAAAIAATDLYVWKLLRLDRSMSRADVEKTMLLLLRGIGDDEGEK